MSKPHVKSPLDEKRRSPPVLISEL